MKGRYFFIPMIRKKGAKPKCFFQVTMEINIQLEILIMTFPSVYFIYTQPYLQVPFMDFFKCTKLCACTLHKPFY